MTVTRGDREIDPGLDQLALAPNTLSTGYGAVSTSQQDQVLTLSSGDYYMQSLTAQADLDLQIDLTSGLPVNIYVEGDADLSSQRHRLMVKGVGTGVAFVPIDQAAGLASLIRMEVQGDFNVGGHSLWGGTVYASYAGPLDVSKDVMINQYIDYYGAVYAYDTVKTQDHGDWNYVAYNGMSMSVPDGSTTLLLLGTSLIGVAGVQRKLRTA